MVPFPNPDPDPDHEHKDLLIFLNKRRVFILFIFFFFDDVIDELFIAMEIFNNLFFQQLGFESKIFL